MLFSLSIFIKLYITTQFKGKTMEEVIGKYEIHLKNRNLVRKFLKVYKNIQKIKDLEDLNLNTISSIRRKLTLAYHAMKKYHHQSVTIKFTIYEYRYFLKIADKYLNQYHSKQNTPTNHIQDEFNQFISQGANYE